MPSQQFPALFQAKSLELIHALIEIKSSVFFLVNPDMRHLGAFIFNAPSEIEKAYTQTFYALDPLNPSQFQHSDTKMETLDSVIHEQRLLQSRYYQEFMQPFQHRFVLDIFFRNPRGQIIALISLLRTDSQGDFSQQEQALLQSVHGFMEYSLNSVYLPKRDTERAHLQQHYAFTERELDVVEWLIAGASNKEIVRRIDMGMATLKTHLNHIYRKAEVQSRTELVAKLISNI